jgi:DNA polymerase eta
LIAINYPARKFGIGRHCNVDEAKKLCPEVICQHVATWREGDDKWAYRLDAAANIATDKVSLDPYRLQSRKILTTIKESLPSDVQKVEKASIDEVFLDLSAQVHSVLLERYEELARPPPYNDPMEMLPLPSTSALDWQADAVVGLDDPEAETEDPDWDDVAILIGSEIVRKVRAIIYEKLQYTCSGGIANNKMLSKLGSGHRKPNQQTVVRNRAIQPFLADLRFTNIRNLGGKLGQQVVEAFGTETVAGLLAVPVEQLKSKVGDDTGLWLHNTIRGIDTSEVSSRTQIKSMLSAKSFRPSINSHGQAVKWLRIFVADIFSRLVEEGVLENKRRPKTINLHHRHGGQVRSRQGPIPQGKVLDETVLFELSKQLLGQIILGGRVWPCANLSLSVGGFEEGVTGNMGIGAFLVKGDEAEALKSNSRNHTSPAPDHAPAEKRRRLEVNDGIQRFFRAPTSASDDRDENPTEATEDGSGGEMAHGDDTNTSATAYIESRQDASVSPRFGTSQHQAPITDYMCRRCNTAHETPEALQSHTDWHLAKDLQDEEERVTQAFAARPSTAVPKKAQNAGGVALKKTPRSKKPEAGQSKLKFG